MSASLSYLCREQGLIEQASWCLNKAISADPADITLRYRRASLDMETGAYLKAAESYEQIAKLCPDNVEALKTAATVLSCSLSMILFYFILCVIFPPDVLNRIISYNICSRKLKE